MQGTGDKGQGLFPLEPAELLVTLDVRGRKVDHTLRSISEADWLQYERLATSTTRRDGERVVTDSLKLEAVEWLYGERIEGVAFDDTVVPIDRVPLQHKEAVIDALAKVEAEPDPAADWLDPMPAVVVNALRNGKLYRGLRHVFRSPSAKQQADYARAMARAVAVEVGKDRRVVMCSTLGDKIDLYDKLIDRVEGYEPNDPKKMDALHKKVAITALMEILLGNAAAPVVEPAGTEERV